MLQAVEDCFTARLSPFVVSDAREQWWKRREDATIEWTTDDQTLLGLINEGQQVTSPREEPVPFWLHACTKDGTKFTL
eukprot:2790899-Amphidinium_carterae.1